MIRPYLLSLAAALLLPLAMTPGFASEAVPSGTATAVPLGGYPLSTTARTITTQFTVQATLTSVPVGTDGLNVWVPIPSDSAWQQVTAVTVAAPGKYHFNRESQYGNRMVYVHLDKPSAPVVITAHYTVTRHEACVLAKGAALGERRLGSFPAKVTADNRVPIGGRFKGIAQHITDTDKSTRQKEHDLFEHVVSTMHYDYKKVSPKYAQGDAEFVCDYKSGNCSDLHSYEISLSRSIGIPCLLEFGYPLTGIPISDTIPADGKVSGYHCWMWFQDEKQHWIPLDAADARRWSDIGRTEIKNYLFGDLLLPRSAVAVSRGRDITLVPAQKGPPLNYFIYPYAEANGQTTPVDWSVTYHIVNPMQEAKQ